MAGSLNDYPGVHPGHPSLRAALILGEVHVAAPQRPVHVPGMRGEGRRGLVVGVDYYMQLEVRCQLHGCVNDALAFRAFLVERIGVPAEQIELLLSVAPQRPAPAVEAATGQRLREAFARLVDSSRDGDEVIMYYAGHGARICNATTGEYIYGFAPADVTTTPAGFANLILGRELNELVRKLDARGANPILIADTCHSAGSVRALGDGTERRLIPAAGPSEWQLSPPDWAALAAAHPAFGAELRTRGGLGGSGWLGERGGWVMAAACRDIEVAHERAWNGEIRGAFTACLLDELHRVPASAIESLRWCDVMPGVQQAVRVLTGQCPTLEGRHERYVFGGGWTRVAPGFVATLTDEPGVIVIAGGQLHGLDEDAEVSIDGARARVESATPSSCVARVTAGGPIATGTRATLVAPGPRVVRTRVLVSDSAADAAQRPGAGPRTILVSERAAASIKASLAPAQTSIDAQLWSLVDAGPADVELRPWSDRGWVLLPYDAAIREPTTDDVIAYLGDAVRPAFTARAHAAITHWARYRAIRHRHAADHELFALLEVALRIGPTPAETARQLPDASGVHHTLEDVPLWVEIATRRPPDTRLFIGILLCSDDGNVLPLWPPRGGDPSIGGIGPGEWHLPPGQTIYVGENRYTPALLTIRRDQQASRYTFKVVACTLPDDALPPDLAVLAIDETVQQAVDAAAIGAPREILPNDPPRAPRWCSWDLVVRVSRA